MRRVLGILSVTLMTAGVVVAADAGLTLAWKEPVSSFVGSLAQDKAAEQLSELERSYPTEADLEALAGADGLDAKVRRLADGFEKELKKGRGIGRIKIPAVGADYVVVQGTDTESLKKGPGHYPKTRLPGQNGTTAIAGHRTTYLAPFRNINKLEPGDEVLLEMPYATFTYKVSMHKIVDPSQTGVVRDVGHDRLVMTACHPLYSAAQRYVVFAELERVSLFGAAGGRWQDP